MGVSIDIQAYASVDLTEEQMSMYSLGWCYSSLYDMLDRIGIYGNLCYSAVPEDVDNNTWNDEYRDYNLYASPGDLLQAIGTVPGINDIIKKGVVDPADIEEYDDHILFCFWRLCVKAMELRSPVTAI